jgi:putative membrane protein
MRRCALSPYALWLHSGGCRYNRGMPNRLNPVQPIMLVAKIVLFLLLLGFAALNSDSVTLRYFLGLAWQAPLSLVILVVFAFGLLTGFLGCSLRLLRNQRELRALQRQLDKS